MGDYPDSTTTIILLSCCLAGLMLLLVYFYKKLNKEAKGEYTIRHMMFKEGGIRDQTVATALTLRTRLSELLRPGSDSPEGGDEIQAVRDEEAQLVEGDSEGSDTDGSSQEEDEEEQNLEQRKGGRASDCSSTSEDSKAREHPRLMTAHVEPEVKRAEKEEVVESQGEGRGGSGLLIDLKQFSGSAIWSEEDKLEREVTSL